MITFFTTTKAFVGKDLINQVNAISSWTLGNKYRCEVIVFQGSAGIEVLSEIPGLRIKTVLTNENGVPRIDDMFSQGSALASNDIVCFLNADIIIDDVFISHLVNLHKRVKRRYLVVGQRRDTDFNYLINFDNEKWYSDLGANTYAGSSIHPPAGSDFFVFSKGDPMVASLPPLLVGRPGWDLYMIYNARALLYKVIDLSPTYYVIHQSHQYGHKNPDNSIRRKEDEFNLTFLPPNEKYVYTLESCNYKYEQNHLRKTYHNGNFRMYYRLECRWRRPNLLVRLFLIAEIFMQLIFRKLAL